MLQCCDKANRASLHKYRYTHGCMYSNLHSRNSTAHSTPPESVLVHSKSIHSLLMAPNSVQWSHVWLKYHILTHYIYMYGVTEHVCLKLVNYSVLLIYNESHMSPLMEILPLYSQHNQFNSDRIYPSIISPWTESPSQASIFRTVPTHNMSNSMCHANATHFSRWQIKAFLFYIHINMVITR